LSLTEPPPILGGDFALRSPTEKGPLKYAGLFSESHIGIQKIPLQTFFGARGLYNALSPFLHCARYLLRVEHAFV
jgi:hypothetical protein